MLFGQYRRRRHQGGLKTAFNGIEHREKGNHRLSAADISLKKPPHRGGTRHVSVDILQRPSLRPSEDERKHLLQPPPESPAAVKDVTRNHRRLPATRGHPEFDHKQ